MKEMTITFPGGKRVTAHSGALTIETDQPVGAGGEGTAASPFEMFLASLGTCAGFFVLAFCQQRGISTDGLSLTQKMETDPETHMVSRVQIAIRLPDDFPEKYRTAVVRAAELCTVKRHLHTPPQIEVTTEK